MSSDRGRVQKLGGVVTDLANAAMTGASGRD
jgi:hypothetical protein